MNAKYIDLSPEELKILLVATKSLHEHVRHVAELIQSRTPSISPETLPATLLLLLTEKEILASAKGSMRRTISHLDDYIASLDHRVYTTLLVKLKERRSLSEAACECHACKIEKLLDLPKGALFELAVCDEVNEVVINGVERKKLSAEVYAELKGLLTDYEASTGGSPTSANTAKTDGSSLELYSFAIPTTTRKH